MFFAVNKRRRRILNNVLLENKIIYDNRMCIALRGGSQYIQFTLEQWRAQSFDTFL
jgi:hypothetical protein